MAPSPGETTDEVVTTDVKADAPSTAAVSAPDAKPAESSPAPDAPKSMLEAVKAAAQQDKAAESSPATTRREEPEQQADAEEGEELPDPTQDELKTFHSRTRRRVQQALRQRDEARTEAETLRPRAENFDRVAGMIREAGLTPQDVNVGFEWIRLAKYEPLKALEVLTPVLAHLQERTGRALPPDLRQKVATGHLPEDAASETAQLRARLAEAERREQAAQQQAQERQAAQSQQLVTEVQDAITKWEGGWQSSDPDFAIKAPQFHRDLELALYKAQKTGTLPRTTAEAVAFADKVRKETEQSLRRFVPRPKAMSGLPEASGSLAAARPEPRTMLEAVRQGAQL